MPELNLVLKEGSTKSTEKEHPPSWERSSSLFDDAFLSILIFVLRLWSWCNHPFQNFRNGLSSFSRYLKKTRPSTSSLVQKTSLSLLLLVSPFYYICYFKMVRTNKQKFNIKYGFKRDEPHSKAEITKITGIPKRILDADSRS